MESPDLQELVRSVRLATGDLLFYVQVSAAERLLAEIKSLKANIPIDMACLNCEVIDCDVRGDAYNIGCQPRVDCLGAK